MDKATTTLTSETTTTQPITTMIIRPTASRLICSSRNSVRTEQLLETFIARIAASSRAFSSPTGYHAVRTTTTNKAVFGTQTGTQRRYLAKKASKLKVPQPQPAHPKVPLRDTVPLEFEKLPEDYTDEAGLPYTSVLPSRDVVDHVFCQGYPIEDAHYVFGVLHGRRVAGTLEDPSLPSPLENLTPSQYLSALTYLRNALPVNELKSAGLRAELELKQLEADAIARGEEIGLYKPEAPNPQSSVKLPSGLETIREVKRLEWEAKAAALEAKKQAELEEYKNTPAGQLAVFDERGVELKRPGENKKLQEYIDAIERDVPQAPPEMSATKRLWPSAVVTLLVLSGSTLFVSVYVPPPPSARLWPDIPPAAATVLPLIAFNALIFCLWRHPPAWKMLNRHFLMLPGYPRALAVLGNAFSHQAFGHLCINMAILFFIGTRLCDEIGRANFLSLYLSTATLGSFGALTIHVLAKNFHVSSLGASTAIYGLAAAYFWRHWTEGFRLFGVFPPEPFPALAGWAALAMLIGGDVWALRRGLPSKSATIDHIGHLCGALTGLNMMQIFMNNEKAKKAKERAARKERRWF